MHTYQIVRNILAACVRVDGKLYPEGGHAVLLYDERNPAFQNNGAVWNAYEAVKKSLTNDTLLQRYTWQALVTRLRADGETSWLAEGLRIKYDI
jgi:hypothetical protein